MYLNAYDSIVFNFFSVLLLILVLMIRSFALFDYYIFTWQLSWIWFTRTLSMLFGLVCFAFNFNVPTLCRGLCVYVKLKLRRLGLGFCRCCVVNVRLVHWFDDSRVIGNNFTRVLFTCTLRLLSDSQCMPIVSEVLIN